MKGLSELLAALDNAGHNLSAIEDIQADGLSLREAYYIFQQYVSLRTKVSNFSRHTVALLEVKTKL